ncbi:hypothetical protein K469DRAFT_702981 [Zopfia rhizophila CBS 207.26]|uniref:Transcription elongation factor Eaf N-terminal domain-containing protein n=1 Tax=Zopfia rhizophila CBS 207.26 TaxID=1314779 RepID=A0A6A6DA85_9PEZI|nr:hypothetical protein K469DRAFT_702981 [Zopfia rhizophila CBS 207.26]
MASPMVEGRSPRILDPHKKAHFNLHISDRITKSDASLGSFSSVKYNHKPAQTSQTRNTTLTSSSSANQYTLKLEDKDGKKDGDVFTFTGQKFAPKKSYVLIFDHSKQSVTLEPLSSTYTFNLSSKNSKDIAQEYPKLYPRKQKSDAQDTDDLFDETGAGAEDEDPDPDNPYDFRHFLKREKRGYESEYNLTSSPDYRTGTGSAMSTPLMPARKPPTSTATAAKSRPVAAQHGKRKSPGPDPLVPKKSTTKKPIPAVKLDRRASTRTTDPKPTPAPAAKSRKSAPKSTKATIKSAEIVHDSDDSDVDAPGSPAPSPPPPTKLSPSKPSYMDNDSEEEDDIAGAGLEIEVPDARPAQKPRHSALASLGLGQNLGLGYLKSPSNGPISLASAANSVEGSPDPKAFTPQRKDKEQDEDVIDFGNLGGRGGEESDEDEDEEMEDRDVEPMDLGSPAQVQTSAPMRKMSVGGPVEDDDDDEDADFMKMMEEQLAGGESSEESEEE